MVMNAEKDKTAVKLVEEASFNTMPGPYYAHPTGRIETAQGLLIDEHTATYLCELHDAREEIGAVGDKLYSQEELDEKIEKATDKLADEKQDEMEKALDEERLLAKRASELMWGSLWKQIDFIASREYIDADELLRVIRGDLLVEQREEQGGTYIDKAREELSNKRYEEEKARAVERRRVEAERAKEEREKREMDRAVAEAKRKGKKR